MLEIPIEGMRLNARNLQIALLALAFVLVAGALLLLPKALERDDMRAGQDIFKGNDFVRIEMPPPPEIKPPPEPELAVAEEVETPETSSDGQETNEEAQDQSRSGSEVSFAESFGSLAMEVNDPSWMDLTFDLEDVGANSASQLSVPKTVTYQGRAIGSVNVHMGSGSTVLVNPEELMAVLRNARLDATRLQGLAGRDQVAFNDIRAAGVDLRYRPAQDQLALEISPR